MGLNCELELGLQSSREPTPVTGGDRDSEIVINKSDLDGDDEDEDDKDEDEDEDEDEDKDEDKDDDDDDERIGMKRKDGGSCKWL